MSVVGQRIRIERTKRKWKQDEVGKILGVSGSAIGMYERGERSPDNEMLRKFADLFGVSIDYLLGRTDDLHTSLEPLTPKEERDIAKDIEKMINDLESNQALAFNGEAMDEESKELLRISLENSMRLAKQLAKKKFTPNKYKK